MALLTTEIRDIAVYGAGGFGGEVVCLINAINSHGTLWNFIGFFDDGIEAGTKVNFGTVIGNIDDLNRINKPLSVVLSIGSPSIVARIVSKIVNQYIDFPNLIAPDLVFMDKKSFSMGKGNLFMFQSLVSCNVTIGNFNLFNVGIGLGHGSSMGSFNSFMSYSKISGEVEIGDRNYFGISSVVLQRIRIGNDNTIGANSVLMRNAKDKATYFGNPAKEIPKPKMN